MTAFRGYPRRFTGCVICSRLSLAVAVVGVLLARTAPPVFAHESFHHASVTCTSHSQHRTCFDHDEPARIARLSSTMWLVPPPKRLFFQSGFTDSLLLTRESEYQYNRPPPHCSSL